MAIGFADGIVMVGLRYESDESHRGRIGHDMNILGPGLARAVATLAISDHMRTASQQQNRRPI